MSFFKKVDNFIGQSSGIIPYLLSSYVMKMWHYLKEGQTIGPVSEEEIKELILEGGLKAFDPLYKEGEAEWQRAVDYKIFADLFQEAFSKEWLILVTRKGQKVQEGPFSRYQVLQKLIQGAISPVDYIWKPDFSEWHLICDLEEFSSVAKITYEPEEDLKLAPPLMPKEEERLQDFEMEEEQELPAEEEHPSHHFETSTPTEDESLRIEITETPRMTFFEILKQVSYRLRGWGVFQGILVGVGIFLVVLYFVWPSFENKRLELQEGLSKRVTQIQQQQTKRKKVQKKPATYIRIQLMEARNPTLRILTDAQGGQKLQVAIYNFVGEIAERRSFYKVLALPVEDANSLDLKNLGLTPGRYIVKAQVDRIRQTFTFTHFFGLSKERYQRALFYQKKRSLPLCSEGEV